MAEKTSPDVGTNDTHNQRTLVERALAKRNEWAAQQPKLSGQLEASWREGLKDLQNAVLHAFPDSQRLVEEPGTPLTPTQQQVTQEQGNFRGYAALRDQAAREGSSDRDREGMSR